MCEARKARRGSGEHACRIQISDASHLGRSLKNRQPSVGHPLVGLPPFLTEHSFLLRSDLFSLLLFDCRCSIPFPLASA